MANPRTNPFAWFFGQGVPAKDRRSQLQLQKRARRSVISCETLEGRVVLSRFGEGFGFGGGFGGGSLIGSLGVVGIVIGPGGAGYGIEIGRAYNSPWASTTLNSAISQYQTDLQKLQTDLQALAAKSTVTVSDLTSLVTDSQSIAKAGANLDPTALNKAVTDLATAVAAGTDTTAAKAEFVALFSGTTVDQTTITNSFNDLVKTITDSKVTPTDLTTVSNDRATLQTDVTAIQKNAPAPGGPHIGGSLVESLALLGIGTGGDEGIHAPGFLDAVTTPSGTLTQLQTDAQKLATDLQGLTAKSGVTIADLTNLSTDSQTIAMTGTSLNRTALNKAVTDLATAVAGGTDTTAAKAEFSALFTGTSVLQATIDKTYADVVQTVMDSKVTPTDINTITTDRTAVQTDLTNLHQAQAATTGTGPGTGGTGKGKTRVTTAVSLAHAKVKAIAHRGHR